MVQSRSSSDRRYNRHRDRDRDRDYERRHRGSNDKKYRDDDEDKDNDYYKRGNEYDRRPSTSDSRSNRHHYNRQKQEQQEPSSNQQQQQQQQQKQEETPLSSSDYYYGPSSEKQQYSANDPLYPGLVVYGKITRIESYGAFLEFQDLHGSTQRGLIHVSQLDVQRVEQVTDVVKLHQSLYAVIVDIEQQQHRRSPKIRLSLCHVNQTNGTCTNLDFMNKQGNSKGKSLSKRQIEDRAKQRREDYLSFRKNWDQTSINNDNDHVNSRNNRRRRSPSYLRRLWSESPKPAQQPQQQQSSTSTKKQASTNTAAKFSSSSTKKRRDESSESDDDSESSSGSSVTSSSSSSVSEDRRKRRRHSRSRKSKSSSRKSRGSSRRSSKSRKRQRRRYSSSSSSSGESSSSSSSSDNSGSSSGSDSDNDASRASNKSNKVATAVATNQDNDTTATTLNEQDLKEAQEFKQSLQGQNGNDDDSYDDEGPMPLPQSQVGGAGGAGGAGNNSGAYGGALLPGEGQAIAQYVQQNLRIPRRGEIGYSGGDIEQYEKSGYVMSGSRHARMNAVRIRKENQVYSAEEQRALALITMEENQQKEAQLMQDFRVMLKEKREVAANKKKGG